MLISNGDVTVNVLHIFFDIVLPY